MRQSERVNEILERFIYLIDNLKEYNESLIECSDGPTRSVI